MTASDALNAMHRRGEYAEVLRAARAARLPSSSMSPSTRLAIAHALALDGALTEAEALVRGLPKASTNPSSSARGEYVLAICEQLRGHLSEAMNRFRQAMKLAEQAGDREMRAWAHLGLFRIYLYTESAESVATQLRDVRESVTRAGCVHTSAYLHECVAVLEGQSGRLSEASRHCDLADDLLRIEPHVWLSTIGLQNRLCIAMLRPDYRSATTLLKRGRNVAPQSGDRRRIAGFEANAAYIEFATGRFDAARKTVAGVAQQYPTCVFEMLGALDAVARLELTSDKLAECEAVLAHASALANESGLSTNYTVRWMELTRVRLLLRRGLYRDAVATAKKSRETAITANDAFLIAASDLLIAQSLAAIGDTTGAAESLMSAQSARIATFGELQGQYFAAVGEILGRTEHSSLEEINRQRARRVWAHHGVESHQLHQAHPETPRKRSSTAGGDAALAAANCIASMFDLATSPTLMAAEVLETLSLLRCADTARLIDGAKSGAQQDVIVLPLGEDRNKHVAIQCHAPDEPHKAIALSNVLSLARAAMELEKYRQEERNRAAIWPADPVETEAGALFIAEEMRALLDIVRRIGPTNVPVLITGETGTGKEVLARVIHAYSSRAKSAFVPFNCSAVPKDMLDAQLFGHRRGAFTGAVDAFPGVIRGAAGGTLFLDEIGETTVDIQPKLLRFLEASEVHPIGELQPVRVDVRVIAATNADLETLVNEGRFREDLFYRLNIVRLHLPPLRERRVEIPALANHYLNKAAQEYGKENLRIGEDTMEYLVLYRWPGNVRQLANEIRRMVALAGTGAVLMPEHLSPEIAASRRTIPPSERVLESTEIVVRLDQPMAAAVQHVERAQIQWAMKQSGGGLEETAAMLGISRKGLYLKRVRFGIEAPNGPAAVEVA